MSPSTWVPVLNVKNLSVELSDIPVLQNINFTLEKGDVSAIVGPNGAGKSTLIKGLLGIDVTTWGEASFWGGNFEKSRKRISLVPQKNEVDWEFPLTVGDVVLQGRYPHLGFFKSPGLADFKIVEESLRRVELWDLRLRPINRLSGGQKQRMFLARSLAQESDLFLMDEPTVGLDAKSEDQFFEIVKHLASEGKTFLVVHHNLYSVKKNFSKALLLNVVQYSFDRPELALHSELMEKAYRGGL